MNNYITDCEYLELDDIHSNYVLVVGDSIGCGACRRLSMKLSVFSRSYPDIIFIYWDINRYGLPDMLKGRPPAYFPYIYGSRLGVFSFAVYSSKIEVIRDNIAKWIT